MILLLIEEVTCLEKEVLLIEEEEGEVDLQIKEFIVSFAKNRGILLTSVTICLTGISRESLIQGLVSLLMVVNQLVSLIMVVSQTPRHIWLPLVVLMEST